MQALRRLDSLSARALEFTILTAARTAETIGMKWSEFDFEERTWTVPAGRMKMKKAAQGAAVRSRRRHPQSAEA